MLTESHALTGFFELSETHDRPDASEELLATLARAVEAKDGTTGDHCDRLRHAGLAFGAFLGLSHEECHALGQAGVLHDIGKLGIPDAILLKPGPLTLEEWAVMKRHPIIGADLLSPLSSMKRVVPIVRHHHEQWCGKGYPDALEQFEIPLLARVFQVLDAYDALTSERPYKRAMSYAEALAVLQSETAKGKWDPTIVERLVAWSETRGFTWHARRGQP